ncbi:fam-g protein [Plasmodium gallinaceum]|uniref:Fam-g protein n=1 Tax=Plasmodium gallinaceum TaxID=5849 RepID=A0A1J1GWI3_PLAGA|nr:fam-g protein [Plasmodium gallinaceum]CRG96915.1 fam-g protein [Plasmodium gallinaceum]
MKTLTLYLKITTFLLLIWMYQCFYNCNYYKTLIDKNTLQTKHELKYERVLTEGDIAGKIQTYSEGCLEQCPLDNKKNKCNNPVQYKNQCDPTHGVKTPSLWENFDKKAKEMDSNLRDHEFNIKWNDVSRDNVINVSSKIYQRNIPGEGRQILILSDTKDHSNLKKLLDECKKEIRDNKTESESMKEMRNNKTESESKEEMREYITFSEYMKETRENRTESESMKEIGDNKTESESKNDMGDNKTESESKNDLLNC